MRGGLRLALAIGILAPATLVLVPWHLLALRFPALRPDRSARAWNRVALRALGWRVRLEGAPLSSRPLLLVSNHVSWADVVVFAAHVDAAFVAKSEVASWPLFGFLAKLHDAIFIQRQKRRTIPKQTQAIAARLASGKALVLFPEGTTAEGNHLLPFKSSLFGAVDLAGKQAGVDVAVQPVAIAYTRLYGLPMGHSERVIAGWVGETSLAEHLRLLFRHGPLDVTLRFGEPLPAAGLHRKVITRMAKAEVQRMMAEVLRGR